MNVPLTEFRLRYYVTTLLRYLGGVSKKMGHFIFFGVPFTLKFHTAEPQYTVKALFIPLQQSRYIMKFNRAKNSGPFIQILLYNRISLVNRAAIQPNPGHFVENYSVLEDRTNEI